MGTLTSKTVEKLKKAGMPGLVGDGDGLYFKVGKTGGTSWIYRYKLAGKSRDMGLGRYPEIGLADARLHAAEARRLTAIGQDPLAARDAERAAQRLREAKQVPFKRLALDYQAAHGQNWSAKWHKGWLRKLELYAFPCIGTLPADAIDTEHVLKLLQPLWASKTRTADEVRGQIEQILDAAKALGLRQGENPARWRGHLDNLLSKAEKRKARKRQHFSALEWHGVPTLMARLRTNDTLASVATQLLILTGARSHMVRFARWHEFDLEQRIWSLPGERMKMRHAFSIPLAEPVVALLRQHLPVEDNPYLFPGQGKSGVMHANAMRTLLHQVGYSGITRHGFRSSFRDWASERTNFPREICELALAHDERDQTEGAYSRSDYFEKRRRLMAAWAAFATTEPTDNVIQADFKRI